MDPQDPQDDASVDSSVLEEQALLRRLANQGEAEAEEAAEEPGHLERDEEPANEELDDDHQGPQDEAEDDVSLSSSNHSNGSSSNLSHLKLDDESLSSSSEEELNIDLDVKAKDTKDSM